MNVTALIPPAVLAGATFLLANSVSAQTSPDLVSPKLREKVVADAVAVVEKQNAPVTLPSPLPNPFVAKDGPLSPAPPVAIPSIPAVKGGEAVALGGPELLAKLASLIPATGTVSLGGEPILLLGQKRLKVGDLYTISFEGQAFELSIAAVTPTSFTVKRGDILHSRPIRLSGSSNTPTNTRP